MNKNFRLRKASLVINKNEIGICKLQQSGRVTIGQKKKFSDLIYRVFSCATFASISSNCWTVQLDCARHRNGLNWDLVICLFNAGPMQMLSFAFRPTRKRAAILLEIVLFPNKQTIWQIFHHTQFSLLKQKPIYFCNAYCANQK